MTAPKKTRNIGHLRELLFDQLDILCDATKEIDIDRARVINDTAKQVIETAKVEVEYARVIQGAMTMPFIENQEESTERPHPDLPLSSPSPTATSPSADERMQEALHSGPSKDHPWRGLGNRVHRMEH